MVESKAWLPDWATHPGEHLAEYLDERGLSQAEFARLADMTPKLVNTIVKRANPVTPESALKLERVLGLKAEIWLGIQNEWDLHQARLKQATPAAADWLKLFPVRELQKIGRLPAVKDPSALVDGLLDLLDIGTLVAYQARVDALAVHHRRSRRGETSPEHEVCWLMLGEEQARRHNLPEFDADRFVEGCHEIRSLTVSGPEIFEPAMNRICAEAGVALIFQKPISKTCLFGSARWLDGERPLIQMSLRMKSNDHFWWTFFHEAAHLVLHRGRNFADDQNPTGDGVEEEADAWAKSILVGDEFDAFAHTSPRSKVDVAKFASRIGIHPGIVVGMLQHDRVIPFSFMNDLKARFRWADEAAGDMVGA
jgi:HTH-type transcriptional regulator/antitoxin HigA